MGKSKGIFVLLLITVLSGAILGLVFTLTQPAIQKQQEQAQAAIRVKMLSEAESFEEIALEETDFPVWAYWGKNENGVCGVVLMGKAKGYGGEMEVTVGVRKNGEISGVSVGGDSFSETPGLGARAKEQSFLSGFDGKTGETVIVRAGEGSGLENEVDAITSATITSKGVNNAVNQLSAYARKILAQEDSAQ